MENGSRVKWVETSEGRGYETTMTSGVRGCSPDAPRARFAAMSAPARLQRHGRPLGRRHTLSLLALLAPLPLYASM
eukprot:5216821-Pyramimonas_sp.AAC.1